MAAHAMPPKWQGNKGWNLWLILGDNCGSGDIVGS